MTRMTRPDCAVMCNLINTHTHTHTHTHTQSSGRKTRIGARSPLSTPCFLSLCRHVVTLAQTCMPSSGNSPSDGYSTGRRHNSNESQHLAEGTEVARLRRRFSFVLQQALSFRTRHHLCRQGVALASTRRPHSQGPASVQAHRTGEVTGPKGQKGANGVGGGIGVGGGNGDGNGDVDGHGDGDGAGAGTGVEVNEGAQDGNGDGNGDGAGTGTGTGTGVGTRRRTPDGNGNGDGDGSEDCSGDGNGDDENGNENRIGEGGREAKKRKKPQNSCRRRAENGGDMGGKR